MTFDYIKNLIRNNLVKEDGILLGNVNPYPKDIDIVFYHVHALEKFLFKILLILRDDKIDFKIESPLGRISKYEKKIHIFENNQVKYQFDLWLIVQSKGRVYFNPKYSQGEIIEGISFASQFDYLKYRKAKVSILRRFLINPVIIFKIFKNYLRSAHIIYFYGPDGIGKTTQINLLTKVLFEQPLYFHTRPKVLRVKSSKNIATKKRVFVPLGRIKSILFGMYWLVDILFFRLKINRLSYVVFDRGPLEVFVQEVYNKMPRVLKHLILKLSRSYTKGIIFTGDPLEISLRKNEMSSLQTRLHLEKYIRFGNEYRLKLCEVKGDASEIHWEVLKFYLSE